MLIENGVFDSKVTGSSPKAGQLLQNDKVKTKLSHYAASPSTEKIEIPVHSERRMNSEEHNPRINVASMDKIKLQKDDTRWSTEKDKRCLEWLEKYHWNKPVKELSRNTCLQIFRPNLLNENIPLSSSKEIFPNRKANESNEAGNVILEISPIAQNEEIVLSCGANKNKFNLAYIWEENKTNKTSQIQNVYDESSFWKKNRFGETSQCCQRVDCAFKENTSDRLLNGVQESIEVKHDYFFSSLPLDSVAQTSCVNRRVANEKQRLEANQTFPWGSPSHPAVVPVIELPTSGPTSCACHELGQIGAIDVNYCEVPHCLHRSRVQQLHVAVMRGFIEVVYHITRLLPHQAFLDLANNTGRTALHLAVSAGVPAIARHLIVCGASPVARDLRGNTPLHVACGRKDAAMVTHLTRPVTVSEVLSAQLSYAPTHTPGLLAADLTNYQGETCVHVAAMAGDKEILQHLTWYGADVNAKECRSGRTALHLAVEARDPELVAHIVTTCRASVTIESYARLSPYQLALANGATGIATQLLDLGAPAQLLPAAYTLDEDDDEYEDQFDYNQDADSSTLDGWQEVDDIRLAGVPIHSSLSAGQPLGPPPVSTAPHTINADLFF